VALASQARPAVAAAKGSLDDVKGITAGAITAGTAMGFGKRLDIVAIEMRQMVQGVVTQRDQLAMQLLSSQGIRNSKFNNMTPEKRIELMRKVFNHPAILKAAREQGQAYMGQMSTLKDVIQIALGQVGHPLMMSLTEEAKKINEWMAKNPKAIAQFARQFGGALKDGFGYVKSVIKFVADNRDVLLSIAKAFLVFKGVQFVGSGLNSLAQGVTNFGGALNLATTALGLFAAGTSMLMDKLDKDRNTVAFDAAPAVSAGKGMVGATDLRSLKHYRRILFNQATAAGAVGADGKFNRDAATRALTKGLTLSGDGVGYEEFKKMSFWGSNALSDQGISQKDIFNTIAGMEEATQVLGRAAADMRIAREVEKQIMDLTGKAALSATDARAIAPPKTKVDVHINKIEVASEDPDRFVFGMVRSFEEVVRNPTQARAALRGGMG
jgi:hypothetical protein